MGREVKHTWGQIGTAREFFRLRNVAGLAGRAVRLALEQDKTAPHYVQAIDKAMGRLAALNTLESKQDPVIANIYNDVCTWHGTGRFQYRQGQQIDILENIARQGQISTHHDTFDITRPMSSVSLGRSRMYARTYADLYRYKPDDRDRHGSSLFWGWMFLTDTMFEAALETKLWTPSGYRKIRTHFGENRLLNWCDRLTKQASNNVLDIYRKGSDIEGNHPIIFGIKEGSFVPASTSRLIAVHEVRSEAPLTLANHVTHVEAPRAHLDEVSDTLMAYGHELPVISLEDAERYVSALPFSALLTGRMNET